MRELPKAHVIGALITVGLISQVYREQGGFAIITPPVWCHSRQVTALQGYFGGDINYVIKCKNYNRLKWSACMVRIGGTEVGPVLNLMQLFRSSPLFN